MLRIFIKWTIYASLVLVVATSVLFAWFTRNVDGPIPDDMAESSDVNVMRFSGKTHTPQPMAPYPLSKHPFMAPAGQNSMHNDSYQSDAYNWPGPLGINLQVDSALFHPLVGNCVSSVLDNEGRLISTCVTPFGVTLVARDPESLAILARKKITRWLPIGNKFGGGVYFHLDHEYRVLLASNEPAIEIWELTQSQGLKWSKRTSIPLANALNAVRDEDHRVIDVLPDWRGNYWFITRTGLVGVSDRNGQDIQVISLENEGIDNAMAVSANGVFMASNHAMYRFNLDEDRRLAIDWREVYDRGSAPKPGTMGFGTGTTPTLLGDEFVAITDNADGRIKVNVFQQAPDINTSALYCKLPVFESGRGTSENSLVALADGFVVENNFGYEGPYENISAAPGLTRLKIDRETQSCGLLWENNTISAPSSVPKASLPNGLIYIITRDESNPEDMHAWYFTAISAHTGELAYKVLMGVGEKFNNHYGSISITPDGSAYVGTMGGVVRVWDKK